MKLLLQRQQRDTSYGKRYRLQYRVDLTDEERRLLAQYGVPREIYAGLLADTSEELLQLAESGATSNETDNPNTLRRLEDNLKRGCMQIIAYWTQKELLEPYEGSEVLEFSLEDMRDSLKQQIQQPVLGFRQIRELLGKRPLAEGETEGEGDA